MDTWLDRLDFRWKQLPALQKRRIVLYSFVGYLLITIAIVAQVIYEVGNADKGEDLERISNPVVKQHAAATTQVEIHEFKRQDNEREQKRESKLSGQ